MTNLKSKQSGRVVYLEYLRVLSIFFVMFHHVACQGIEMPDVPGNLHVIYTILASERWPIGVLVMISGFLFLGRDVEIKKIYTRYLPRIVAAYFAWKFFYAIYECWGDFSGIFEEFLRVPYHLWYLPMIAGLYVLTPIFRQLVKDEKIMKYFLVLSFIFAFVFPQIKSLASDFLVDGSTIRTLIIKICSDAEDMHMETVFGYGFYYVMGFFMGNIELNRKQELLIYAAGIIANIATIVLRLLTETPVYFDFFTVNMMLMALAIFTVCKQRVRGAKGLDECIFFLSKYSFGAYLVHVLIMGIECTRFNLFVGRAHPLLSVPAITVITFTVSMAVSYILNHVPFVKKYIV